MKRQIVLVVSLVCGLLAAIMTRLYISAKEAEVADEKTRLLNKYGTIDVLAFAKDCPAGTVITDAEIGHKIVPRMGLDGQAVERSDMKIVLGRRLANARSKLEVLFWSDIEGGDPSMKGLSSEIRRQMRAISVNVNVSSSVSGMIKPNDHVDVIGTFNFPDDEGKIKRGDPVTSTVLQNVLVLATGKETSKTQGSSRSLGVNQGYSTVTLEVTPREAEVLAFAEQIKGRLVLTLRNRNDTSYEKQLPQVDFNKIREEIEDLNAKRQMEKLSSAGGR
ncbi:MAG: Flp pilus assembly protein CpaB [Kiritimatiellae bacterium]|nr:Flp pilus assembly protein CpaB [Kiritimatiellia bacterium]